MDQPSQQNAYSDRNKYKQFVRPPNRNHTLNNNVTYNLMNQIKRIRNPCQPRKAFRKFIVFIQNAVGLNCRYVQDKQRRNE